MLAVRVDPSESEVERVGRRAIDDLDACHDADLVINQNERRVF